MNILKRILNFNNGGNPIDKKRKTQIASCALLLEVAKSDGEFSNDERDHVIDILKDKFLLNGEEVHALIDITHRELGKSLDLWQFTNSINKNFTRDEKIEMVEMIWQVVYVDQKLDKHEDHLMHKFQDLLNLTHKELINAKMKALGKA